MKSHAKAKLILYFAKHHYLIRYIYIYIYRERERERVWKRVVPQLARKKILGLFYPKVESSILVHDFAASARATNESSSSEPDLDQARLMKIQVKSNS
jgi:hypothetical protein